MISTTLSSSLLTYSPVSSILLLIPSSVFLFVIIFFSSVISPFVFSSSLTSHCVHTFFLLSSLNIFIIIALNPLSVRLFIYSSPSSSGILSCLIWDIVLCSFNLPNFPCIRYTVMLSNHGEVTLNEEMFMGPSSFARMQAYSSSVTRAICCRSDPVWDAGPFCYDGTDYCGQLVVELVLGLVCCQVLLHAGAANLLSCGTRVLVWLAAWTRMSGASAWPTWAGLSSYAAGLSTRMAPGLVLIYW